MSVVVLLQVMGCLIVLSSGMVVLSSGLVVLSSGLICVNSLWENGNTTCELCK